MIDRQRLLSDLQGALKRLEADLLERSESRDVPDVGVTLRAEFDRAKQLQRTAQNYGEWRSDAITQASAAWVLACVFVRFLEDNRLIEPPKIAGPGDRLLRAREEWELYLSRAAQPNEREYLWVVFDDLAKLPGTKDVFGEHNPIREVPNWLSADGARMLLDFFQKIDANSGVLVHDFTDLEWDTRFLGDLYQDLSEAARKKYALLQTPEFVEEFILERTLEPALDEFGLEQELAPNEQPSLPGLESRNGLRSPFKMIDPACGSGHFLLGAFRRILERWQRKEPGTNVRDLVQRSLDSIHGVDVNPFAIAIARFRLLLSAMRACGIVRLADAPAFRLNLVCGDSLLHAPLAAGGKKYTAGQQELDFALASDPEDSDECDHAYMSENLPQLKRLLRGAQYHAVVANPPYIVPKDRQLNERYRLRFLSCHRQYSLAVPFLERIFRLAVMGGFTGQITANSFMRREFGKKLIEAFFPTVDLTHVIDTSLAYIPGHGTPTVILFGRHRAAVASTIRCVGAIKREDEQPVDAANGLAWTAIVAQVDTPGSQSEYVSVGDMPREMFHKQPWSIGGGGAAELKVSFDESATTTLGATCDAICSICLTREDEAYLVPLSVLKRRGIAAHHRVRSIQGEQIRDWQIASPGYALFPYDANYAPEAEHSGNDLIRFLWERREFLWRRREPNGDHRELNRTWWEWSRLLRHRLTPRNSISMAFVATHNHFLLDRDATIFNRSAPVIKLPKDTSDDEYLGLLGLLNCSSAAFWLRQACHDKGGGGIGGGIAAEAWERFFEYGATKLEGFPLPAGRPLEITKILDSLAGHAFALQPNSIIEKGVRTPWEMEKAEDDLMFARSQMIAFQEELDWECYHLYGLISEALTLRKPPPLKLGQRAFEILLARKVSAGEMQTTWFERHGSTPITAVPAEWPDDYRQLVERRIAIIETDPNIRLIEQPEYKRRWNTEPWDSQLERALREWLLDRLESYLDFDGRMNDAGQVTAKVDIALISIAKLADVARQDAEFQQVGELYREDPAFDVHRLVTELVAAEVVPLLPALLYKESGLRKRAEWERTWELQREEDRLDVERQAAKEAEETECKRVKAQFSSEAHELEKQRAKLMELTRQLYEATGHSVPEFDPKYEAEIHASVLAGQGMKSLESLSNLLNQIEQIRELKRELTEKIAAALKTDSAYQEILNRLASIPLNPEISVPPKYTSADFISSGGARYWTLRGKLDVPKERWVSFPHCEGPDGTLVIAWAGYDHLQLARAISAYYVDVQERLGGRDDPRLIPLLASLIELLPWLKQWHNQIDSEFGMAMGDYFEGFVNEEAKQLGQTHEQIKAWTPPQRIKGRKR